MLLNCGVGEDSWESLGLQGDPTNPSKGKQYWIFIGRTDAEAETPILWPPDAKNWLIGKDPDAQKDWRQEEKGTTVDEISGSVDETVAWYHWLDGHEFELASGVGDRQGRLACCSPWGHKVLDMTEQLNWTELKPCEGSSLETLLYTWRNQSMNEATYFCQWSSWKTRNTTTGTLPQIAALIMPLQFLQCSHLGLWKISGLWCSVTLGWNHA